MGKARNLEFAFKFIFGNIWIPWHFKLSGRLSQPWLHLILTKACKVDRHCRLQFMEEDARMPQLFKITLPRISRMETRTGFFSLCQMSSLLLCAAFPPSAVGHLHFFPHPGDICFIIFFSTWWSWKLTTGNSNTPFNITRSWYPLHAFSHLLMRTVLIA